MRNYHPTTGGLGYSKAKLRKIGEQLEAKIIAKERLMREQKRKQKEKKNGKTESTR